MPRFSETLMDHFQAPRNRGRIEAPDVTGLAGTPGQGRHLALYAQLADNRVARATFECHGCGVTVACGSALTEMMTGRSIGECSEISSRQLVDALDGIPADRADCPDFALRALRHLLQQIPPTTETVNP